MDLKVKDVAEILGVSETTVRRWLSAGKIPAYRLHNQYRFDRVEVENWMMNYRRKRGGKTLLSSDMKQIYPLAEQKQKKFEDPHSEKGVQRFSLYRAIYRGGVLTDRVSKTKKEIIAKTMEKVARNLSLDSSVITELLLDRERLMPTALSNGVAVPHTRDFLLKGTTDMVVVVFPFKPIEWGALDKNPIHTLFFLFACNDKRHLHLLAKLAHLSSNEEALELMRSHPNKEELLSYLKKWESRIIG